MASKIPVGWSVKMASDGFVAPSGLGRLLVTGPTLWTVDYENPSNDGGWGWTTESATYHEDFLTAAIGWLCGSTSGNNILMAATALPGLLGLFGPSFQGVVTGLGNTLSVSGFGDWGGETLSDYNLLLTTGATQTNPQAKDQTNAYLDAHYGSVLGLYAPGAWLDYGIVGGEQFPDVFYEGTYSGERMGYFECAPLGGDTYGLYQYAQAQMNAGTQTRPGTVTHYLNNYSEIIVALWENP